MRRLCRAREPFLCRFNRQRGQGLIEYAFLIMLVGMVALLGLKIIGSNTQSAFCRVSVGLGSTQCMTWKLTSTPTVGVTSRLNAAVAIGSSDVWVGGYSCSAVPCFTGGGANNYSGLLEHWNGSSWTTFATPATAICGGCQPVIYGFAALGTGDVWAVGEAVNTGGADDPYVAHWNGSAWSDLSPAHINSGDDGLSGVIELSASDIWAAGHQIDVSGNKFPLIEHYNGSAWTATSPTGVGTGDQQINGITGLSDTDLWIAGANANATPGTMVLHCTVTCTTATNWSAAATTNVGAGANVLMGIVESSSTDVWAVGQNGNATPTTLVEHCTGGPPCVWATVASTNTGGGSNALNGIGKSSSTNLWAVGSNGNATAGTLAEQCTGASPCTWQSPATTPNNGSGANYFEGVGVLSSDGEAWGVGYSCTSSCGGANEIDQAVVERLS